MPRHAAGEPVGTESEHRHQPAGEAALPEPLALQVERQRGLDSLHHLVVESPHRYPNLHEEQLRGQQVLAGLEQIRQWVTRQPSETSVPEMMALAEALWLRTQGTIGADNQDIIGHPRSEDGARMSVRDQIAHTADGLFADIRGAVYGETGPPVTA